MEDIAPKLFEKIKKDFLKILENIDSNAMNYIEAQSYAESVGSALAEALERNLSSSVLPDGRMYWNIADRVIRPLMEQDYELVSGVSTEVQRILNEAAGIGIKPQIAQLDADKIDGILNKISSAERYDDVAWVLNEPIKTFSRSIVDDTLKVNVEFQGKSGLHPKIIRKQESKCCKWCEGLAGTYNYPDVPKDVYRRHERCRCTVEYDPGTGKRQDVHTKQWKREQERDKIEIRKTVGLKEDTAEYTGLAGNILRNPSILNTYTPEKLKRELEGHGYEVKPLGKGNFKGISFENGGGFRINFGGDGILTYHPESRSHHKGEYYKISTGKGGTRRYDRHGQEKND